MKLRPAANVALAVTRLLARTTHAMIRARARAALLEDDLDRARWHREHLARALEGVIDGDPDALETARRELHAVNVAIACEDGPDRIEQRIDAALERWGHR